ncbi:MAG TPA: cytochrome c [Methylorubrum populi]|uniref:Cytochrome c n=1 Tax=Methylorubrum populi TaxID=223967 RepID=A0A921E2X0_9HYPH|nr:cytochrome c [Methylorubrum populi]
MRSTIGSGRSWSRLTRVAPLILSGFPAVAAPTLDGPFTERQAERGQAIYNDHCAECHRPDLTGALGSSLVDGAFKRSWAGKPVSDLRAWIKANMPPNAPDTLPDDQLDPIVALILMKNGVAPGQTPLSKANAGGLFPEE